MSRPVRTNAEIHMPIVLSTFLCVLSVESALESPSRAEDRRVCDVPADVQTPSDSEVLSRKISLNVQNVPLSEVLQQIAKLANFKLKIDTEALKEAQISLDRINNVSITNIELQTALTMVMWQQQQSFSGALISFAPPHVEVRDGVMVVSTWSARSGRLKQKLPTWLQAIHDDHKIQVELNRDQEVVSLRLYRPVTDELLGQITTLTKLRVLEIHGGAEFTADAVPGFAKLSALERLQVSSSAAANDSPNLWDLVLEQLGKLESFRSIDMAESGVSDAGIAAICRHGQLTSIRFYQEGRVTDLALEAIANQTHLKRLDLTSYVGTSLGRMQFSRDAVSLLKDLDELESLDLPGHNFDSDLFDFPHLRSLRINGSLFQAADAANIARCPELQSLDLSYLQIDNNSLQWLADHPKLGRLHIRCHGIRDEAFASLRKTSRLTHIHLWTSGLTDRSLEHFATMPSLADLSLNWGTNSFTTDGIKGLADSASLKSLELRIIPQSGGFIGVNTEPPDLNTPVTIILPKPVTRPKLRDEERKRLPFDIDPVVDTLSKIQVSVTHDEFFGLK